MNSNNPNVERSRTSESNRSGIAAWWLRNFWGLATIVIVAIICAIAVKTFKKPGQMGVIEAQSMDMSNMVPPVGAVPVGMSCVEPALIEGSVTYTGTVQAYEDEDIYPRVTGRISRMPVYPGDRVFKGDLLVQLDPGDVSEYKARFEEARYEANAEMHNASIAKEQFSQKQYELKAAEEAEAAAEKAIEEAKASLSYWIPETKREKALLDKEVVSLAEYQLEESQCNASKAREQEAEAKLRESRNKKMAAQAELYEMAHHVGHEYLQAKKAKAAELNAALYNQYTQISAKDDGVVTRRLISPGVVVNPGMLILKVAHVKQVRVQAEVASEDAEKIALGDPVIINGSKGSKGKLEAKVTSIFPAADPTSRTFIVEALVDNVKEQGGSLLTTPVKSISHYYFLPGQYVIMRIVTGKEYGLAVPTSAVVWKEGKPQVWKVELAGAKSTRKMYTCLMHWRDVSDKPGKCPKCGMELQAKERSGPTTAKLVDIEIGLSNPDKTEVVRGLQKGDAVLFAGYENLRPDSPVVSTEWGDAGPVTLPAASEVTGARLDAGNKWSLKETLADLMVTISISPIPPESGSNSLLLKIERHNGGIVSSAIVSGKTSMPGMNMAGPDLQAVTDRNGEAKLKSDFMSGPWQANLTISAPGEGPVNTTVDIEVP